MSNDLEVLLFQCYSMLLEYTGMHLTYIAHPFMIYCKLIYLTFVMNILSLHNHFSYVTGATKVLGFTGASHLRLRITH